MSMINVEAEVAPVPSGPGSFALDRRLPAAEQVYRLLRNESTLRSHQ
jgi:hypothetical protein